MSSTPRTGTLILNAMNAVRRATGSLQRNGSGSRQAWSSGTETGQAATSTSSAGRGTPSIVNVQRSLSETQVTRRAASTKASRAASRRARASVTRGSTVSGSTL